MDKVKAIDTNLFSLCEYASQRVGGIYGKAPDFSLVKTGVEAWGNFTTLLDLRAEGAIERIVKGIWSGEVPNLVLTGPTSLPEDADSILDEAGFTLSRQSIGMNLELSEYSGIDQLPAGLEIVEAKGAQLADWSGIVCRNLFRKREQKDIDPFTKLAQAAQCQHFCAYMGIAEGIPVSASACWFDTSDQSGGIYFVATESEARGKGFGKALTARAIEGCVALGAKGIILQATDLGLPVYKSLGFKPACVLKRFTLPGVY